MGRILLRVIAGLLVLVVAGLAAFYIMDGHPLPETEALLENPAFSFEERADGSLLFRPAESNGRGLLIMHGALIKPRSYAKTAAFFAGQGYTVLLPYGGISRLSINAIDAAGEAMTELALDEWFSIGHSMGGMASMEVVSRNPELPIRGAALWASAMPADYSAVEVPILCLWGDTDGLLPRERFENGKALLPDDVLYVTVDGANHRDFAMYSHQFFDREGTLGWSAQIEQANRRTLSFFESLAQ